MSPQAQKKCMAKTELKIRYTAEDFSRNDESEDSIFYSTDRMVSHLDGAALSTVQTIVGQLIIEKNPVVLDLMASWDSHIPESLTPEEVVGLGLNQRELSENSRLSEYVLHDLNRDPVLPFPDSCFDVVLNTVSVDYMTRPIEVFQDVGRILKPGGLFLVIFSNRWFEQKVTHLWRTLGENERVTLVEDFFYQSGAFEAPTVFISKGLERPHDDKYAGKGIASDPIYAVYAERKGAVQYREERPAVSLSSDRALTKEALKERMMEIKNTHCCPYCGEKIRKWAVPDNPFSLWSEEYMYICFNDACPYLLRGWNVMESQGNRGSSYRLMYDPFKDICKPVPVPTLSALKDGIID